MALGLVCILCGFVYGVWLGYRLGWLAALRMRRNQAIDAAYAAEKRDNDRLSN